MAERQLPRQARDGDQEFTFTNVQLFKNETLGTGSYGAVCRAKCDQLICAAKLIWPALLQLTPPDPGKEHRQPFRRFESECRFLSCINHPNIVQYLGTYRDPETNAPVLLMELMDESLTHYLESSAGDIPYHIQVNLASDIAQALAFLHANGIIHRDLSSNNVLLIAGSRAKVTDFGMLKFLNTPRATMTTCPGTPAFMSPEALNEPPVYTEKLDNFSFGVILVQIVTRQYPKPSDRFDTVRILDPRNPTHTVDAQLAVAEVNRRQAHISLIEPSHPLKPIALDCLKDRDVERPSSQQLCQSLDTLKRTARYEESSQQDVRQLLREKDEQIRAKDDQIQAKDDQIRAEGEQYQEQIRAKDEQIQAKDEQIQAKDEQIQAKDEQIQAKDDQIRAEGEQYQEQIRAKDEQLQANQDLAERLAQTTHENQALRHNNQALQSETEAKERQLRRLNQQLEDNEGFTATLQQTIAQRDREMSELRGTLTSKNEEIQDLSCRLHQVALEQATPTGGKCISIVWETLRGAPVDIIAGSSTVISGKAYFRPSRNQTIHTFNSSNNQWDSLPDHPLNVFTIVSVDNMLTTVGGHTNDNNSNKLYSYIKNKWVELFPPMSTKRQVPAVVYTRSMLVVAGGYDDPFVVSTVEVLNIRSKLWSKVGSLPFSTQKPSITICEGNIYLHPGYYGSPPHESHSVIKCSLSALVQSEPRSAVWERIASLPVHRSSLATINGQLLAVGGLDNKNNDAKDIHQYNPTTDSWQVVSQMSVARSDCLTASLPGNKLMVVGGRNISGTTLRKVEMAKCSDN